MSFPGYTERYEREMVSPSVCRAEPPGSNPSEENLFVQKNLIDFVEGRVGKRYLLMRCCNLAISIGDVLCEVSTL